MALISRAEIKSLEDNKSSYLLSNTALSVLVALRKTLLSESQSFAFIPSLIDVDINFTVHHTVLLQEIVSQLPIIAPERRLQQFADQSKCDCDFLTAACSKCSITFELAVLNDTENVCLVTSDDFYFAAAGHNDDDNDNKEPKNNGDGGGAAAVPLSGFRLTSQRKEYKEKKETMIGMREAGIIEEIEFKIFAGIELTKLNPKQSVKIRASAKVGCGKIHTRFSPIRRVGLQPNWQPQLLSEKHKTPVKQYIVSDEETKTEKEYNLKAVCEACPKRCFTMAAPNSIEVSNGDSCINCNLCLVQAEKTGLPDLIRITAEEDQHRFIVETHENRNVLDVIREGGDVLLKRLGRLRQELLKLKIDFESNARQSSWISHASIM